VGCRREAPPAQAAVATRRLRTLSGTPTAEQRSNASPAAGGATPAAGDTMADLQLFRGLRYSADLDLGEVVCPPYDVLSADEARRYAGASPFNAIHVHKPAESVAAGGAAAAGGDPYAQAAAMFAAWQRGGVLVREQQPALYTLEQQFRGPDGVARTRRGFIARLRLEEFGRGIVLPHERTNAGPKRDRLALLRSTRANMSQIFLLYPDEQHAVWRALGEAERPLPAVTVRDQDGVVHTLQPAVGPRAAEVAALLADRQVIIADGQHRYETALAYRDEQRAAGSHAGDWVMAYFCGTDDPGLAIFPAHRLLRGIELAPLADIRARLAERFDVLAEITGAPDDPAPLLGLLGAPADAVVFGLVLPGDGLTLVVKLRDAEAARASLVADGLAPAVASLPVTILHHLLLRDVFGVQPGVSEGVIDYFHRPNEAFASLRAGEHVAGAFLNSPTVDDVQRVTAAGEVMPQKATYFYPKLLTGLVFASLDE
jgi:uncharacterized protein (DUF1015 family)